MANKEYVNLAGLTAYKSLWETKKNQIIEEGTSRVGDTSIRNLFDKNIKVLIPGGKTNYRSSDGVNFETFTVPTRNTSGGNRRGDVYGFAFGKGLFVSSNQAYSEDGYTWSLCETSLENFESGCGIVFCHDMFFVYRLSLDRQSRDDEKFWYSADGKKFTHYPLTDFRHQEGIENVVWFKNNYYGINVGSTLVYRITFNEAGEMDATRISSKGGHPRTANCFCDSNYMYSLGGLTLLRHDGIYRTNLQGWEPIGDITNADFYMSNGQAYTDLVGYENGLFYVVGYNPDRTLLLIGTIALQDMAFELLGTISQCDGERFSLTHSQDRYFLSSNKGHTYISDDLQNWTKFEKNEVIYGRPAAPFDVGHID